MVGRNDPCPCGSGKKYKKCCLQKDLEAERLQREAERLQREAEHEAERVAALSRPEPPPPPLVPEFEPEPPDPRRVALDEQWDEFDAEEDYRGHVAVFLRSLDDGVIDDELAFEMLNTIYYESVERDERDRFDELVMSLRERQPELYSHDAHYYLDWLITNALVTGRLDAVPALGRELVASAGRDVETFFNVVDRLAYHGQLAVLVEMMRIAWPDVRTASGILPWGVDEFAASAVNYVIFDYLERAAEPRADDPELLSAVEFYVEPNPSLLSRHLAHLTGQAERRWTPADFDLARRKRRQRQPRYDFDDEVAEEDGGKAMDEGRQNLHWLTNEFLGYLRRQEGIPYTKGELAREQILRYLVERYDGDLEAEQDIFATRRRPPKKRRPQATGDPGLLFCPDHDTLDRFLVGLLGFPNPQYYKTAAMFELVPAWLRFLEGLDLIDPEWCEGAILELRGLATDLRKIWEEHTSDPTLMQALTERWGSAAVG